jgi:hypothetical protein
MRSVRYYTYRTEEHPFYKKIQEIFSIQSPLELIHTTAAPTEQVTFDTDTSTDYHQIYYKSNLYKEMIELYDDFLVKNILPIFNEDIVVQKEPSFRICLPNNTALGKCLTDTDSEIIGMHCDSDYNHPAEEINFMLTITGQEGTNSCYIETEPGKADFFPVTLKKGDFMSFYGNKCRHYNKVNTTNQTRISIDFRVIPYSEYKDETTSASAVHSNRKFCIGEYFKLLKMPDDMPLESYTVKELEQLKELTLQSVSHYTKLLEDSTTMASLKDGDRMALKMCFDESKKELHSIESVISQKLITSHANTVQ